MQNNDYEGKRCLKFLCAIFVFVQFLIACSNDFKKQQDRGDLKITPKLIFDDSTACFYAAIGGLDLHEGFQILQQNSMSEAHKIFLQMIDHDTSDSIIGFIGLGECLFQRGMIEYSIYLNTCQMLIDSYVTVAREDVPENLSIFHEWDLAEAYFIKKDYNVTAEYLKKIEINNKSKTDNVIIAHLSKCLQLSEANEMCALKRNQWLLENKIAVFYQNLKLNSYLTCIENILSEEDIRKQMLLFKDVSFPTRQIDELSEDESWLPAIVKSALINFQLSSRCFQAARKLAQTTPTLPEREHIIDRLDFKAGLGLLFAGDSEKAAGFFSGSSYHPAIVLKSVIDNIKLNSGKPYEYKAILDTKETELVTIYLIAAAQYFQLLNCRISNPEECFDFNQKYIRTDSDMFIDVIIDKQKVLWASTILTDNEKTYQDYLSIEELEDYHPSEIRYFDLNFLLDYAYIRYKKAVKNYPEVNGIYYMMMTEMPECSNLLYYFRQIYRLSGSYSDLTGLGG